MDNHEILSKYVGEDQAKEILRLAKAYDNYISKFKKKLDKLLEPANYEVKTGITFAKKSKENK